MSKLTDVQRERFTKEWGKIPRSVHCPLCQRRDWEQDDQLWRLESDGAQKPLAVIRCRACNYVLLFDAEGMGLAG